MHGLAIKVDIPITVAGVEAVAHDDRIAIRCGVDSRKAVVALLLDKGADVNAKGRENSTPLHMAAAMGHKDVVALLLDKGADVNAKDNDGDMAIDVAETEEIRNMLK